MDGSSTDNYCSWINSFSAQDWFTPDVLFNDGNLILSPQAGPSNTTDSDIDISPLTRAVSTQSTQSVPAGSRQASSLVPPSPSVPHPLPLDDSTKRQLLEMGTTQSFLILFQHGSLTTLILAGNHVFQCPLCESQVNSSIPGTILLASHGQFNALANHYRKKSCIAALARKEKHAASTVLQGMDVAARSTPSSFISTTQYAISYHSPKTIVRSHSESDIFNTRPSAFQPVESLPPQPCLGLPFRWRIPEGTNMQMNIPWTRTLPSRPDELSFIINLVDGQPYARSYECTRATQFDGSCCPSCAGLAQKLSELGTTITTYKTRTRRNLLNTVQLYQALDDRNSELNKWKLKLLNDGRRIACVVNTVDTHSALVMALSQCDAPWLRHILQTLLKNGASISTILRRIEEAIANGYNTRKYNQSEFDLALLVYRVGGTNLLTALSQRLCLPAVRTVRNNTLSVKITPTIGSITPHTISQNIHSVIIDSRAQSGQTTLRGVSLLTDETALEEAATYHPAQNGVGGLCWKHAGVTYPYLDSYESAEQLATKIAAGDVHLGKEVSVIVAHCFGEDQTYPVLAAPSCKQEDHSDWELLMQTVIDAWYDNDAHKNVGPLWSFATDGDATRRKAGHKVFLQSKLTPSSPIYGILSGLPGLNLYTGPHDMTLDFDYKHILKRFCTLLRSTNGLLISNGRRVNSKILLHYLCWLDDCDKERAHKLLFPDDPQDVPRAVELIRAVVRLSRIDPTQPPYNKPGEIPDVDAVIDLEAISLISTILHNLLEPFVNPYLSLSEQVSSLSMAAHLIISLYRAHRTDFLPNPLMYDTMTMIKNVIFCAAKQLRLDPVSSFFLPDVGTDAIEKLFAYVRMCGGHNSGINYKQAIDRLRSARDISGVYSRNPDLHRGHRRLNLTRSEHVDHINRDMWDGDILVRNCNLEAAWLEGQYQAASLLALSTLDSAAYDYNAIFSVEGVDMLCIFGGGKYPGINHDDDSSILVSGATAGSVEAACTGGVEAGDGEGSLADKDSELALTFEEVLENEMDNGSADETLETATPTLSNSVSPLPPSGKGVRPEDYLLFKGVYVHKSTACRLLFNKDYTLKSPDRLLRVRGFTPVNKRTELSSSPSLESSFIVGNPFVTLIRLSDHTTALGLVHSTNIQENGVSRNDIDIKNLQSNESKVKVTGNVLRLLPCNREPTEPGAESKPAWIWNGGYLKTESLVSGCEGITTEKVVELSALGALIEPINPSVVEASTYLPPEKMSEINSRGVTWLLDEDILTAVVDLIWKRMVETKIILTSIPLIRVTGVMSEQFPYRSTDGIHALLCEPATTQLSSSKAGAIWICPLCRESTDDIRSHMGQHILRSMRNVEEVLITPVDSLSPCGFCGRSQITHPDCGVRLKITASRPPEILTKCSYEAALKYKNADKGSQKRPCRNVPVFCPLCPLPPRSKETDWRPAVWRYNMEQHLNFHHSRYAHPGKRIGDPLPEDVATATLLTSFEEAKLGVDVRARFTLIGPPTKPSSVTGEKRKSTNAAMSATTGNPKRPRMH